MTEQEWLTSNNPAAMLAWLIGSPLDNGANLPPSVLDRKLRLFTKECQSLCLCDWQEFMTLEAQHWAAFTDRDGCPCTRAARSSLLRCIFGNPFRIMPSLWATGDDDGPQATVLGEQWLSTNDKRAYWIALAVYTDRDFAALPLLADALEEAGCSADEVCRWCVQGHPVHPQLGPIGMTCPECGGTGRVTNPLLLHLRGPGPHAGGCWALDLILGKN